MSTLKADTIVASDGSSPVTLTKQEAAKNWVNFDGSGTVSIRQSLNASGLVDNGTGDYTINFTNSMSYANYSITTNATGSGFTYPRVSGCGADGDSGFATTSHGMTCREPTSGSLSDTNQNVTALHGDLA